MEDGDFCMSHNVSFLALLHSLRFFFFFFTYALLHAVLHTASCIPYYNEPSNTLPVGGGVLLASAKGILPSSLPATIVLTCSFFFFQSLLRPTGLSLHPAPWSQFLIKCLKAYSLSTRGTESLNN